MSKTLLPVLCVGRGLVVYVSESCSRRFGIRGWTCRRPRPSYIRFCLRSGWVHPLLSIVLHQKSVLPGEGGFRGLDLAAR